MPELDLEITRMIREAKSPDGMNTLFSAVYDDLKRIARGKIASFPQSGDLQATEVVHDVFVELNKALGREGVAFESRAKFFSYASTVAFRDILRSRSLAAKFVELDDHQPNSPNNLDTKLALEKVLERLGKRYPRAVKSFFLREVAGMELEEVALSEGYASPNTLRADLVTIRRKVREAFEEERAKVGAQKV